jgi:hypothetical protein
MKFYRLRVPYTDFNNTKVSSSSSLPFSLAICLWNCYWYPLLSSLLSLLSLSLIPLFTTKQESKEASKVMMSIPTILLEHIGYVGTNGIWQALWYKWIWKALWYKIA